MHPRHAAAEIVGTGMSGRLLLVDDDPTLRRVLLMAMERRGFEVIAVADASAAKDAVRRAPPDFAVVDLNLPGESGLMLLPALVECSSDMRIVVLTGYASVATTVEAMKLGATHYLAKPADADEIVAALFSDAGDPGVVPSQSPLSLKRMEWEYIQRALAENDGNISATARQLGMHLRTLQRKLQKRPVRH